MVRRMVPKVIPEMAEIRYVVVDWTNLQLVVLKILTEVSCEEGGFVGFVLLENAFVFVGSGKIV